MGHVSHAALLPKTSMRLSFSLPKRLDSQCDPDKVRVKIQYTKINSQKRLDDYDEWKIGDRLEEHDCCLGNELHELLFETRCTCTRTIDICMMEEHDWKDSDTVVIRQYETMSPITREKYSSDYIYHVALDDLQGDSEYMYTISVEEAIRTASTNTAATTTSTTTTTAAIAGGGDDDCRITKSSNHHQVMKTISSTWKNGNLRGSNTGIIPEVVREDDLALQR
jgi:hypothetical protein